jgi:hypothetical protein
MTDSEKLIPKYAAQALQSKRVTGLTFEELRLVDLLVKHGYLRPATNGFCGSMTSKAMIRDPLHECSPGCGLQRFQREALHGYDHRRREFRSRTRRRQDSVATELAGSVKYQVPVAQLDRATAF